MLENYKEELKELTEEMEKALEYVYKMNHIGTENVKLYDVCCYYENYMKEKGFNVDGLTDEIKTRVLQRFLDNEFENFQYFLSDNYCKMENVGSTSSFYIISDYNESITATIDDIIRRNFDNEDEIFYEVSDTYFENLFTFYKNYKNGNVTEDYFKNFLNENDIETDDIKEVLDLTVGNIKDFIEDCKERFDDGIKKGYDYITDFKENQVTYFKEYLDFYDVEEMNKICELSEKVKRLENEIDDTFYSSII